MKLLIEFAFQKICSGHFFGAPAKTTRPPTASFLVLAPVVSLLAFVSAGNQPLKNAGFEAATAAESWKVDPSEAKQDFSLTVDQADAKEGKQSLLVAADHPVNLTLRQEVFLPVGTLWRLSGWIKSAAIADSG